MVILPMILLGVLGAALGYVRQPSYTATAQLSVGELNVADPAAVGSVLKATESLAAVYSRRIDATDVRDSIRRRIGPSNESASIAATPLPQTPIIRVSAKSTDERTAIKVANAGAAALVENAQRLGEPAGGSREVFERYRETARRASEQEAQIKRLRARYGSNPTAAEQRRIDRAQAEYETTRLQQEGLRLNYQATQQTLSSTPPLRIFAEANAADSDRRQSVQVLLLLGLIAGAVIGAALATFRLNRRVARLTRP